MLIFFNTTSAPDDYAASTLTLSFGPGIEILPAPILIVDDAVVENSELFNLELSSTDSAADIPTPDSEVLITDDNVNDCECVWVVQVHCKLSATTSLPQLLCLSSLKRGTVLLRMSAMHQWW